MRRGLIAVIAVAFAVLWIVALVLGVKTILSRGLQFGFGKSKPFSVTVPKGNCPTSLAVFNFRPQGSSDAKYYAIGFARALADRTYCAPKHITQQMSINEISDAICCRGKDSTAPVSDKLAVEVGKKMGVSYVITGDMSVSGGRVEISVCVIDITRPGSKRVLKTFGSLADLPNMQSRLAPLIMPAMKITPDPASAAELRRPNFSKSETLKLYGRSFLVSMKDREALRWQALNADPASSFALIRLLDFYWSGPSCCAELRANQRLAQTLTQASAGFSNNSQIAVLRGLLLAKESEYKQAEAVLQQVAKDDPDMIRAHTALGYVARLRQNGDLAVSEALKASNAWPNNAYMHASLAQAYDLAATNVRHGHYSGEMSGTVRRVWEDNTWKSFGEAYVAVTIDPDCSEGWSNILDNSLQLSRYDDRDKAYRQLIRINPTNMNAYVSYAICFTPQWGGSDADQQRIFTRADKAFPKGSHEPLVIRAAAIGMNSNSSNGRVGGPWANDVLQLSNEISRRVGDKYPEAVNVKFTAYELTRRRADLLKISEYAYNKWGGLTWQYRLGMGYAFAYEDKRNMAYLEKARQLFADYEQEVPFDPRGYIQLGWCLSHQGKRDEARAQFLKALQLDPANEVAREKLKYVQ